MDFKLLGPQPLSGQQGSCIILGVYADNKLTPEANQIDQTSGGYLSQLLERGDITGKLEQTLLLHTIPNLKFDRVLLVGLGQEEEFQDKHFIKVLKKAYIAVKNTNAENALCTLTSLAVKNCDAAWRIRKALQSWNEVNYQFEKLKSKTENNNSAINTLSFLTSTQDNQTAAEAALAQGQAIANGMKLAKDLGNLPSNICTPSYLAEQANELHKEFHDIKVTIIDEKHMEKLGMGSLLSVSKGSREPAKLITMEYQGATKNDQPVVLVGKGVTFDTGGISLKPKRNLDEMKYDMCGAASVFGTIRAIAEMRLPINVVGIIPSTENLPGGEATKPGDIVRSMSGQTIDILDTDAEGRLILCDAITYSREFNPAVVIDIATLTGAVIVALGHDVSALFTNDAELAKDLEQASQQSCDYIWRLPLWEPYQNQLDSKFADIQNIGKGSAGSIIGGLFLQRFTEGLNWAHLDVAGTAFASGANKGATARPVPLLTQYLMNRCQNN